MRRGPPRPSVGERVRLEDGAEVRVAVVVRREGSKWHVGCAREGERLKTVVVQYDAFLGLWRTDAPVRQAFLPFGVGFPS